VSGVAALSVGLTVFFATREPDSAPASTRGLAVTGQAVSPRTPGGAGALGEGAAVPTNTASNSSAVVEPMAPPAGTTAPPPPTTPPDTTAQPVANAGARPGTEAPDPAAERARAEALRKRKETVAAVIPREQPMLDSRRVASREAVSRGEQALRASRYTVAAKEFNIAIESDPSNARAYAGLAQAEWENARYEESLRAARQAAQREPGVATHHVLVGDAAVKLGRQSEAVRAYERAAALKPSDSGIRDALEFARAGRGGR
ncbi:MAG TPA: tetratricopeptide repeat protein, partial [Polyangia bacterium]